MHNSSSYDLFISYANSDRAWVEGYLFDALNQAGVNYTYEAAFELGRPRLTEFERAVESSKHTLLVISPAYLADGSNDFVEFLAQTYGLDTGTWQVIPLILQSTPLPPRLAMLTALDLIDPTQQEAALKRLLESLQRPLSVPTPPPPCPYPGMVPFSEGDRDHFFGRDEDIHNLIQQLRLSPFLTVIGPSGSGKSSLVFAGLIPALRTSGLFGVGEWLVFVMRPGDAPLDTLSTTLGGDTTSLQSTMARLLQANPAVRHVLLVVDQFEEVFTLAKKDAVPFQNALLQFLNIPNCYVILTVRADFYSDLMGSPLWSEIQDHRVEVLLLDDTGLRQAIVRPAENVGVYVEPALVERLVADAADEPGVLPLVQETLVLLWEKVERRYLPLRAYDLLVLPRGAYGATAVTPRTGLQVAIALRADAIYKALSSNQQAIARRIFLRLIQFGEGRADTRRKQTIAELRSSDDDKVTFDKTLECLTHDRLLTKSGEEKGAARDVAKVDIAHEALITGWPLLQSWIQERREAEQTRRRLEDKAEEWVRLGSGQGGLLDQVELLEAERWLSSADANDLGYNVALPTLVETSRAAIRKEEEKNKEAQERERDQLKKIAEEQRARTQDQIEANKRLRTRALILTVVLGVAVVLAILAFFFATQSNLNANRANEQRAAAQTQEANANEQKVTAQTAAAAEVSARETSIAERNRAEMQVKISEARRLVSLSQLKRDEQLDLALLLGVEASRLDDNLEVRRNLFEALTIQPQLDTLVNAHSSYVKEVAFNLPGTLLASAGSDGKIFLWDAQTLEQSGGPLIGHTEPIHHLVFSPEGKVLASASDNDGVILWDVQTRQRIGELSRQDSQSVHDIAFSRDGQTLSVASNSIVRWNLKTLTPLTEIKTVQPPTALAYSPSSDLMAWGMTDGSIQFWDDNLGQTLGDPLTGHEAEISSLAFSPDGKLLASGSKKGDFALWEVETRSPIRRPEVVFNQDARSVSVAFSPDGKHLATAGGCDADLFCTPGGIVIWDVDSRLGLDWQYENRNVVVGNVAFSPDGKRMASSGCARFLQVAIKACVRGAIGLWQVKSRDPLGQPLMTDADLSHVALSPDGKTLAVGNCNRRDDQFHCLEGKLLLWDVTNNQILSGPPATRDAYATALAFSSKGDVLAAGGSDGSVSFWNRSTDKPIGIPSKEQESRIYSIAFSPDDKYLASLGCVEQNEKGRCSKSAVVLWDAATYTRLAELERGDVTQLAFSPGTQTMAVVACTNRYDNGVCNQSQIELWDITSKQRIGEPLPGPQYLWLDIAFSPDGKLLMGSGCSEMWPYPKCVAGAMQLWDMTTHRRVGEPIFGTSNYVRSAAFAPDNRIFASATCVQPGETCNSQSIIYFYDLTTHEPIFQLSIAKSDQVLDLAFAENGQTLISATRDTITKWDLNLIHWQRRACSIAHRNLSRAEYAQYINSDIAAYDRDYAQHPTCEGLPTEPVPTSTPAATTPDTNRVSRALHYGASAHIHARCNFDAIVAT